ncbi:MAG: DsrE/DsrF/DrsH-like family protein [Armatimonadota bacterium]
MIDANSPADLESRVAELERQCKALAERTGGQEERCTIVAFSGEMDNLLACFNIACGAAAMGLEVEIFFTFWGLNALRRGRTFRGKSIGERMVAMMMPRSSRTLATSRLNMGGAGPVFFKYLMGRRGVSDLPTLVETARELGVRFVACEMSMGVMGIAREELIEGIDFGGAATYLDSAARSKVTLFI